MSITLLSCASTGMQTESQIEAITTGVQNNSKYSAWHLSNLQELKAINVLLDEADLLIEKNALNEADDKLERVLRIKPQYAPAWSRLSWIALQSDKPARSVEMAKRSNSFAYSNPDLQLLNWSFIRTASQQLNDNETYNKADQKINSLKSF